MACNITAPTSPHYGIGALYIFNGSVFMATTIPCLLVISQKDMLHHSCYKFMLVMGLLDVCNLITSAFISGIYSLTNTTFCGHETSMTIVGRLLLGLWTAYSLTLVLLAFNRWLDIKSEKMSQRLFSEGRTWYWMVLPVIYGCYFASPLVPELLYNTDLDVWVFDLTPPMSGEKRTENPAHTINNIAMLVIIVIFYLLISIELRRRSAMNSEDRGRGISVLQKQVMIQSLFICIVTMLSTISYIVVQYVVFPAWLTKLTQISWQATHGPLDDHATITVVNSSASPDYHPSNS